MKKTIKLLSIASVAALTLTMGSCTDFLTIYPTDKVVLEDFWKDKADVNGMVINCYKNLVSDAFVKRVFVYGELRSDDVIETTHIGTDLKYINNANLLATNGYCDWSIYYKIINNCNIVLHFAPNVLEEDPDFTQGDYNVVRGEMLAMRALCHFYLVRAFRDVPLLKEAKIDDSQDLHTAQSTPLEALDFILEDLNEAEHLVLPSGAYPNELYNKGRFTADAVRAIRADVLLWKAAFTQFKNKSDGSDCKEFYAACIKDCEQIIADRKQYLIDWNKKYNVGKQQEAVGTDPADALVASYPLETHPINRATASVHDETYVKIFADKNDRKESILELQLDEDNNHNQAICSFYGYSETQTNMPFTASSYLGKEGTDDNVLYKKTDARRVSFTNQHGNEEDVFPIAKYTTRSTSVGGTNQDGRPEYFPSRDNGSYSWQNVILYRITDVMLMEAEARALRADSASNDLNEAFKLVKAVYYRSNKVSKVSRNDSIKYAEGSAASLQELVLKERQRELCFEGKRWFDLVRMALRDGTTNNMLNVMVPHKYETNQSAIKSKMASIDALFFPIHETVLKTDTMLVQNPVWVKEDVYSKK
ncbi:MAG: RagB/SusD family nutrient uptake outer membrane protein [Bacteroidaceae bacterium]|nr:RagB/SusD family nutrient uptake outer membrane protein [Bacteroidaceae bacterium]